MTVAFITANEIAAEQDELTVEQVQAAMNAITAKSDENGFRPALTDDEEFVLEIWRELEGEKLGLSHFVPASREVLARHGL